MSATQTQVRQYLYFCTSKTSKLSSTEAQGVSTCHAHTEPLLQKPVVDKNLSVVEQTARMSEASQACQQLVEHVSG
jgi:hypothetical protein